MENRIKKSSLKSLVGTVEQAAALIKDGMTVAMSGYAMAGYPKAVVESLVARKQAGEDLKINLITGANVPWVDENLGQHEIIARRAPMIASRTLAGQSNKGTLHYVEQQMNQMPKLLKRKAFGEIEVAVIEALGFDEDGNLIPSSSVGMVSYLMDAAKEIVVEINMAHPEVLMDLHDIHTPEPYPNTKPIPLCKLNERVGVKSIPVDESKIRYIVETNQPEDLGPQAAGNEVQVAMAENLFKFLNEEFKESNGLLPPVQLGFGGLANAIAESFKKSDFHDLQFFCGGITEPVMELLASGKAKALSTGGLGMSPRVTEILNSTPDIADKLFIRNGDITNNGEIIGRLGVIALNTGIEIDIYGNVNSSHIAGSRVVNGIGGGANFAQNAGLSVMLIPSNAKGGAISNIVPMVSHQDICEHDIDVIVTENGVADLRGLDDGERADLIIENCAADVYKGQLKAYLEKARRECGGHHPQLPADAFEWYRRLKENKTMMMESDS